MKVSVIIPTHNRPELLKKAVYSVLNQTYPVKSQNDHGASKDLEVIVVDVGLEQRAENIIQEFHDERLFYIKSDVELNGSVARNIGIRQAKGEFIALLDDDDEWLPEKLEVQMKEFEKTPGDVGFCFSAVTNVFDNREENTGVPEGIGDYLETALMRAKTFLNVTLLIKKYVFDDVGLFDEKLPSHQESDLIIRISKKYKGLGINVPLVRVNMSVHESVGRDFRKKIAGREIILNKHMDEFKKRPAVLAKQYFWLGIWYRDGGQYVKAKEKFKQAWQTDFRIRYFLHYLALILGVNNYNKFAAKPR